MKEKCKNKDEGKEMKDTRRKAWMEMKGKLGVTNGKESKDLQINTNKHLQFLMTNKGSDEGIEIQTRGDDGKKDRGNRRKGLRRQG